MTTLPTSDAHAAEQAAPAATAVQTPINAQSSAKPWTLPTRNSV